MNSYTAKLYFCTNGSKSAYLFLDHGLKEHSFFELMTHKNEILRYVISDTETETQSFDEFTSDAKYNLRFSPPDIPLIRPFLQKFPQKLK
jgi:hypothetical protein